MRLFVVVKKAGGPLVTAAASSPLVSWLLWTCLCYLEGTPIHVLAIELVDGFLSGALVRHLDEGKAPGSARHAVRDETHGGDFPYRCKEL